MNRQQKLLLGVAVLLGFLIVSGRHPYDRVTWWLEILPILVALPVLALTYRRCPLSNLLYSLICIHALLLMIGGHYTYARVPFGFALKEWFSLGRNPYDKIGHFAQGFVPALLAREVLLRGGHTRKSPMLAFIVVCIALAISAAYELVEWASALVLEQGADEFLGTQGDVWDTQSDMFFALSGAITALVTCSGLQDRQMERMERQD